MRARYLFDLASICHISPLDVDALRFLDFVRLALRIDAIHKANKPAPGQ